MLLFLFKKKLWKTSVERINIAAHHRHTIKMQPEPYSNCRLASDPLPTVPKSSYPFQNPQMLPLAVATTRFQETQESYTLPYAEQFTSALLYTSS